jgi:hypothetical protein
VLALAGLMRPPSQLLQTAKDVVALAVEIGK